MMTQAQRETSTEFAVSALGLENGYEQAYACASKEVAITSWCWRSETKELGRGRARYSPACSLCRGGETGLDGRRRQRSISSGSEPLAADPSSGRHIGHRPVRCVA